MSTHGAPRIRPLSRKFLGSKTVREDERSQCMSRPFREDLWCSVKGPENTENTENAQKIKRTQV